MTADRHDPPAPADDHAVARLRSSLDAVTATTPVHADWDDVVARSEGVGSLAPAPADRRWAGRRPALVAAALVVVAGLAAAFVASTGRGDEETVRSAAPTTSDPLEGLRAGDRYAPTPLPSGWSVLSITDGVRDLGATCPCRVARWTDGEVVATYREAVHLPPPFDDPGVADEPLATEDGRLAQDRGSRPWVRWELDDGEAEVVVAGGPDRALSDAAIAQLVEDLDGSRGASPSDLERWYAATPVVDLAAGDERTRATTVRLAVGSGGTVSYRIEVSGAGTFTDLLDDSSLDAEATAEAGPTLRRNVDPRDTQGVVGSSLTLQAEGADLTASYGGGSVEPGRSDGAPRATDLDAESLLASLARVDAAGWSAFAALAPAAEAEPTTPSTDGANGTDGPAPTSTATAPPLPGGAVFTVTAETEVVYGSTLTLHLRLENPTDHIVGDAGCLGAFDLSFVPIDDDGAIRAGEPTQTGTLGRCETGTLDPGQVEDVDLPWDTTDPGTFGTPLSVGRYRIEAEVHGGPAAPPIEVEVRPSA